MRKKRGRNEESLVVVSVVVVPRAGILGSGFWGVIVLAFVGNMGAGGVFFLNFMASRCIHIVSFV